MSIVHDFKAIAAAANLKALEGKSQDEPKVESDTAPAEYVASEIQLLEQGLAFHSK